MTTEGTSQFFVVKKSKACSRQNTMTTTSVRNNICSNSSHGIGNNEDFCMYMQGDHVRETVTHVHVHETVVRVSFAAFRNCQRLREVVLPVGLEVIGHHAFENCTALEHVHVPSTVIWIGHLAFHCCSSLRSMKLAEGSLRAVGQAAFVSSAIESIALPRSVTELGWGAFSDCHSLRELHLHTQTIDAVTDELDAPQATIHLRGSPVQRIPIRPRRPRPVSDPSHHVFTLYSRVSIPPRALVVTQVNGSYFEEEQDLFHYRDLRDRDLRLAAARVSGIRVVNSTFGGGSFEFCRHAATTLPDPQFAQVFIDLECLNSLTDSELSILEPDIADILGGDISEDWPDKHEQLTELLHPHELNHKREITTILELALWRKEIQQLLRHSWAARAACLHASGSGVIIPGVMSFL